MNSWDIFTAWFFVCPTTARSTAITLEAWYNSLADIVERLGTRALSTAIFVVEKLTRIADYPIDDAVFWKEMFVWCSF